MSERRCILTGERTAPDDLIRLAVSPDDLLMPDVRAKAPGRGAWIGVSRTELEAAIGNGKFRGALARAFKTGAIRLPDDLPVMIDAALTQQAMDRLGLEAKASTVITGSEKIETACRRGQVHMLFHASDAAPDGRRKLDQAWRVGEEAEGSDHAGQVLPVGRDALSKALGRENVVHIAIVDSRAADRLSACLRRWQNYSGCANGGAQETPSQAQPVEYSTGHR
ncbi:MAG: DUF448 domain-containing protein [Sphingobium sp.]|nr:DUF448 domain-containing protein [Sphingobium sp.]